jgi:MFS family permease
MALAVVAFFVAIGFGIIGPAIPLLAAHFGVSDAVAGTAISMFAMFRFLSAIGCGRVVRVLGERTVLTAGLLLHAVTSILAGLAPSFDLLIAMRAIGGIGSAGFTVSSIALLIRIVPANRRGMAMSTYQGGFILGFIAGPALGGLLTQVSPRLPLIAYGAFLLIAAVVGRTMLRGSRVPAAGADGRALAIEPAARAGMNGGQRRGQLGTALRSPAYRAALLANLGSGWVFYGMRTALLPLYVSERLGRSAAFTGMALLVSAAAQAICLRRAGPISDRWGRRPALLLGTAVAALSVAAFTLPISSTVFLLPMVAFGAGGALVSTAPAALVADVSRGHNERIIALFTMMSDLGAVVGPLVSGWLADRYSFSAAFWVAVAVLSVGFGMTLAIPRAVGGPARASTAEPQSVGEGSDAGQTTVVRGRGGGVTSSSVPGHPDS